MKKILLAFLLLSTFAFSQNGGFYENVQKKHVSKVLDDLNEFAAKTNFKKHNRKGASFFDSYHEVFVKELIARDNFVL